MHFVMQMNIMRRVEQLLEHLGKMSCRKIFIGMSFESHGAISIQRFHVRETKLLSMIFLIDMFLILEAFSSL